MGRGQRGVIGVVVLAILAVVMAVLIAGYALTRMQSGGGDRETTLARLELAQVKLDAFAAANRRLPCPADPTLDTGVEGLTAPGAATCTGNAQAGTLPWSTLGMKREEGFDAWGRKISYRVYLGNNGSLVQPGGIDMTQCDTVPVTGVTTPKGGGAGGLCVASADPTLRSTSAAEFLSGKGLEVDDLGNVRNDVAYVVVSHGASGLGGWSASGTQLPVGGSNAERKNTEATGRFTRQAFSDVDKAATDGQHYDDFIAYRTILDLVKMSGLEARDWPEAAGPPPPLPPPAAGETRFTAAAVSAAGGSTTGPDTGRDQLSIGGAVEVRGFLVDASNNASNQDLSFQNTTLSDGNVVGGLGIPGAQAGLSSDLTAGQVEVMRFRILSGATRNVGLTLTQFGVSGSSAERFRIYYLNGNTVLGQQDLTACHASGGSFSLSFGADFDFIGLQALPTTTSQTTSFFVAAFRTCAASPCLPSLSSNPDLASCP